MLAASVALLVQDVQRSVTARHVLNFYNKHFLIFLNACKVKPVFNDPPRDPKIFQLLTDSLKFL
jgi:hypothetical protein